MKVKQITVTLERTFQLAPFNGVRISFSEQIDLGPDDDPEKVRRLRLRSLKRQIALEVDKAMEEAK